MYALTATSLFLAALSGVSATLNIDNWCYTNVYIYQSHNGGCNSGPNGICEGDSGAAPFVVDAGNGSPSDLDLNWISDDEGTSVKIATDDTFNNGILQFEYTMGDVGLYWDLSDLDGAGAGLVGTPFAADNVKASTTGDGSGTGTCVQIRCPANTVCVDAYQNPDDADTHWCPEDTGDLWLDLCEPESEFESKRALRRGRRFI